MNALFDFDPPTFSEVVAYLSGVADGARSKPAGPTLVRRSPVEASDCPRAMLAGRASLPVRARSCDDALEHAPPSDPLLEPATVSPSWVSARPPRGIPGARYSGTQVAAHTIPYSPAVGENRRRETQPIRGIPCRFVGDDADERPSRATLRPASLPSEWYALASNYGAWP